MKTFYRSLLPLGWILFLFVGCSPEPVSKIVEPASTYFPINIGEKTTYLQLALNKAESQQGLMNRTSMDLDHGMIFVFDSPGPQSFWMKNTRIPLDIGFFDANGKLLEVHALYPYDETAVPSYSRNVLFAVEMNQGWFARNQIQLNSTLDLEQLREAILQRGVKPNAYLLDTK
ncbi:MAG: DUF192 domain-containing protein [Opitutaceae bacterium]